MAYTRIHAIKSTVTKAVAYICNPDKTEQQLLVDSFGCSPETARHDFDYALSRTKQSDKNQAYHLIQSFAKGEVSHEEAHRIGIELADKLLGGKYSYVVYVQWKAEQEGTSWKKRLQEDIDECTRIAKSYEDFLRLIREKGYTVTGEIIGDPHAKYIKFTAPGQERPVRGSFRNFGAGYTKEEIKDRIENPEKWQKKEQTVQEPNTTEAPKQKSRIKIPKKDIVTRTGASRTLIDTSGEKFQNSPGLQHWASVKNLKTAAASYAVADNLSQLQKQIDKKTAEAKSARTELVELEHQMKKVSELLLYAEQYRDNKPFQDKYKKSKDPDRYLRMHETQLILYDGAERMLRKMGLDPKSVEPSEIRADYEAMQSRKTILEKTYKSAENEVQSLQQKMDNVQKYVGRDSSHDYVQQQVTTGHDKSRT